MRGPAPASYTGPVPNYFVIGGPKCGSSTLCNLLGQHPDVFISQPKEPHFFGRDVPERSWAWYLELFEGAESATAIGEGSTSYTHPNIIERVATELRAFSPDARLVYIVRHPMKRLESDWRMRKFQGWGRGSINEAVLKPDTSLTRHGLYWQHLEVYRKHFDDEQIQVLFLEDLVAEPDDVMARCFRHLGVDSGVPVDLSEGTKNQSSDFRAGGPVFKALRRILPQERIRRWVPDPVRRVVVKMMTTEPDLSVSWNEDVRTRVSEQLRSESERLLEYCGKPPEFWRF